MVALEMRMNTAENEGRGGEGQQKEIITFYVEDNNYAVDLKCVRELICSAIVTRVKYDNDSKCYARINLRGKLVRIFDMQKLLGRSRKNTPRTPNVLMIEHKTGSGIMAGLIFDSIGEVIQSGRQGHSEFLKPAGRDENNLIAAEIIKDGRSIELLNIGHLFEIEFKNKDCGNW